MELAIIMYLTVLSWDTKATLFFYFEGKKMFKSKWLYNICPIYIPKVMGYWCYFLRA